METIGENTIYEASDGTIEIAGPNGWVRVEAAERRKLAALIGEAPRSKVTCMFCGHAVAAGFECANCHRIGEASQDFEYVWTIFRNGVVHRIGKDPKTKIFQRFNDIAKGAKATHWDWENKIYSDDQGNWFALEVLGEPAPSPTVQYLVPRIFENV